MVDIQTQDHSLEITKINGRTQIVFKKALLKGKTTTTEVLNTILMVAKRQAELYLEKLSRGAPLDVSEVKALKELAEITKLEVKLDIDDKKIVDTTTLQDIKSQLYLALTEKKD